MHLLAASLLAGASLSTAFHIPFISKSSKDVSPASMRPDICWRACFPEEPRCPEEDGWYSKQFGECWTCCRDATKDSIEDDFKAVQKTVSAMQKHDDVSTQDICLKVCWPEIPSCPKGWYSNNFGTEDEPCWTCCKAPADAFTQALKAKPAVKSVAKSQNTDLEAQEICLKVCWPEIPSCPKGWYSNNFGTEDHPCWTCCKAPADALIQVPSAPKSVAKSQNTDLKAQEICLAVCWEETPTCPNGWYSNNFGTENDPCWTCCKAPEDAFARALISNVQAAPKSVAKSHKQVSQAQNICLRVCWPEEPTCADGWFSNNLGSAEHPCWTCCKAPEDAFARALIANVKVAPKSVGKSQEQVSQAINICWRVCWPETPTCPDGWFSNNLGNVENPCWTCCKSPAKLAPPTKPLSKSAAAIRENTNMITHWRKNSDFNVAEICWLVCFPKDQGCPSGWSSKQFGECWTCCRNKDEDASIQGMLKIGSGQTVFRNAL